jgi:hypothetical protein
MTILAVGQEFLLTEVASGISVMAGNIAGTGARLHCQLEPVCTMCAQIAARFSQECVNTWIQLHTIPGVCPDTVFWSYVHIAYCAVTFKDVTLTSFQVST